MFELAAVDDGYMARHLPQATLITEVTSSADYCDGVKGVPSFETVEEKADVEMFRS